MRIKNLCKTYATKTGETVHALKNGTVIISVS